jgi:hypothetical protein
MADLEWGMGEFDEIDEVESVEKIVVDDIKTTDGISIYVSVYINTDREDFDIIFPMIEYTIEKWMPNAEVHINPIHTYWIAEGKIIDIGLLMENIPVSFRRRFNYNEIKGHLLFIMEEITPCDYGSLGDFIGEMCDMLVNDLIDDYYNDSNEKVDNKTKDDLYYFMVDTFADYLQSVYDKECN